LLEFVAEVHKVFGDEIQSTKFEAIALEWKSLEMASGAALELEAILHAKGRRKMARHDVLRAFSAYHKFLVMYTRAGGHLFYKCHQMFHMIHKLDKVGHPAFYHTFLDESINGLLAKLSRNLYRNTWQERVHWRISVFQELGLRVDLF
jgi:hypothetical protein